MIKLLNAGFTRLKKDMLFLLLITFTIGLSCFMIYIQWSEMTRFNSTVELDQLYLNNVTFIGIIVAIFTSLIIGREYSDGTLRNKIIIGASRHNIYLSNLIIVAIVSILAQILYLVIISIMGIPIFGGLQMPLKSFGLIIFCLIAMIIAFASIFTFISMIIANKTASAVSSILFAFGLMMLSLTIISRFEAPEYYDTVKITNNETQEYEIVKVKNPKYLTEEQRKIYKHILKFIPSGQAFLIAGRLDTNIYTLPLYSLGVIVVFTISGIIIFNKKELK
ncbi:MAG: ABC transporter permease [Bacilli bacterium]|nr:ABC transporter permease [Bacilli bacterium]